MSPEGIAVLREVVAVVRGLRYDQWRYDRWRCGGLGCAGGWYTESAAGRARGLSHQLTCTEWAERLCLTLDEADWVFYGVGWVERAGCMRDVTRADWLAAVGELCPEALL